MHIFCYFCLFPESSSCSDVEQNTSNEHAETEVQTATSSNSDAVTNIQSPTNSNSDDIGVATDTQSSTNSNNDDIGVTADNLSFINTNNDDIAVTADTQSSPNGINEPASNVTGEEAFDNVAIGENTTDDTSSNNVDNTTSEQAEKDLATENGDPSDVSPLCIIADVMGGISVDEAPMPPASSPAPAIKRRRYQFICAFPECNGLSTDSDRAFKNHILTEHHRQHAQPCAFCNYSFANENFLIKHIRDIHSQDLNHSYMCTATNCEYSTNILKDLDRHIKSEHKEKDGLSCYYCYKTFTSCDMLIRHLKDNVAKIVKCPYCNMRSETKQTIMEHVSRSHPQLTVQTKVEISAACQNAPPTGSASQNLFRLQQITQELRANSAAQEGNVGPGILRKKLSQVVGSQDAPSFLCACSSSFSSVLMYECHIANCDVHKTTLAKEKRAVMTDISPHKAHPPPQNGGYQQHRQVGSLTFMDMPGSSSQHSNAPTPINIAPGFNIVPNNVRQSDNISRQADIVPQQRDIVSRKADIAPVQADSVSRQTDTSPRQTDIAPRQKPRKVVPAAQMENSPKLSILDRLHKDMNQPKCDHCNFMTCFKLLRTEHVKVHKNKKDNANPFSCQHCPFGSDSLQNFQFHLLCHEGRRVVRLYNCAYCSLSSNSEEYVEDHLLETHPTQELRFECKGKKLDLVNCTYCEVQFASELGLLEHLASKHGEREVATYVNEMYGIMYMAADESVDDEPIDVDGPVIVSGELSPRTERVNAALQDAVMASQDAVIQDPVSNFATTCSSTETEEGIMNGALDCTVCNYSSNDLEMWKKHQMRHIGVGSMMYSIFFCDTCDWPSTDKKKIIDHCMKEHMMPVQMARERGYEIKNIEVEGKQEENNGDTDNNENSDSWELPDSMPMQIDKYHCDFCLFDTNERGLLANHMAECHGNMPGYEAPEVITHVESGSSSPSYMGDEATNISRDQARYKCGKCPYYTDKLKLIKNHEKTHEKQAKIRDGFKCSYCCQVFTTHGNSRAHHNRYHGSEPYSVVRVVNGIVQDGTPVVIEPEGEAVAETPVRPGTPKATQSVMRTLLNSGTHRVPSRSPTLSQPSDSLDIHIPDESIFRDPIKCPKCPLWFKIRASFLQHWMKHQEMLERSGAITPAVSSRQAQPTLQAHTSLVHQVSLY